MELAGEALGGATGTMLAHPVATKPIKTGVRQAVILNFVFMGLLHNYRLAPKRWAGDACSRKLYYGESFQNGLRRC
jgi:hypothetical protein